MIRGLLARLRAAEPAPERRVPWVVVGAVTPPRGADAARQVVSPDGSTSRTFVDWPDEN